MSSEIEDLFSKFTLMKSNEENYLGRRTELNNLLEILNKQSSFDTVTREKLDCVDDLVGYLVRAYGRDREVGCLRGKEITFLTECHRKIIHDVSKDMLYHI
jgi:hypothetical protein